MNYFVVHLKLTQHCIRQLKKCFDKRGRKKCFWASFLETSIFREGKS